MSTNTLVSDILAEHDARQRKQPPPTPKEVHARMIEMTNAANGLRYEVARLGDIERQLKAVHERMGPLILRAAELNNLICERVSQASQPWAIHESEELMQKVQQLERENAEQCVMLGKGGERECALLGKVERLERENAALREARKPVAVPGLHGLVTWYADAQQLGEAFQREREKCIRFEEVMQSQGDEIRRLTVENDALRQDKERLDWLGECHAWPEYFDAEWHVVGEVFSSHRAAIDAARKEATP